MKIPTDEEINHWVEINLSDWQDGASGAFWMRDQLKPLLDLVEQLREARKEYQKECGSLTEFGRTVSINLGNRERALNDLRDKLELGE